MRAIRFSTYGDSSVLQLADAPQPVAGPGQALVRVAASTFNFVDAAVRAGFLREAFELELPHIPGIDVSGTVEAVGPDVDETLIGTAVIAFLPMNADGSAAEYVVVPAGLLVPAPANVPLPEAAALPSSGLTAREALVEHAELTAGQRILINGAGGAVGGFAVQLAKSLGATVIATAGPRSTEAVRAAGADEILDYTVTQLADAVTEPVDVVLNLVRNSPEDVAGLLDLLTPDGVFVSTTTPAPEDDKHRHRSVFVRNDPAKLAELVRQVEAGELTLDVSARYDLAELAEVHALGEAGKFRGKVLVTV